MPGKQQEDQPAREVTMNSPQQLLPCRECGAACEVVPLKGPHIQGECLLWACSQNQRLGGNCPDENVYLTEKAWNTRTTPPSDEQEVERVAKPSEIARDRADWLLDAVATATQDRRYLRGDPEYDEVAGEAILLNGEKAICAAISATTAADTIAELRDGLRNVERIVLEQRCERNTPWDRACVEIAKKVREYAAALLAQEEKSQ